MTTLSSLKPNSKPNVIKLLDDAGFDVSGWASFKGKHASQNPKSYHWAFQQDDKLVALCLWHRDLKENDDTIEYRLPSLSEATSVGKSGAWTGHRNTFRRIFEFAYVQSIPVRVIVVHQNGPKATVDARLLDSASWSIRSYSFETGEGFLARNKAPSTPVLSPTDLELVGVEGKKRYQLICHRERERMLRNAKLLDFKAKNRGRVFCEVPKCGIEFGKVYGAVGEGFAHVHHVIPLSKAPLKGLITRLSDLRVVCPNCHAMIHAGGQCRPLVGLIL